MADTTNDTATVGELHGGLLVNVGQAGLVALLYVPEADEPEQTDGTLVADVSPLGSGAIPFRRMLALNKAAYDQVRSRAESWVPLSLENCSAIEPLFMACDFWGVRT